MVRIAILALTALALAGCDRASNDERERAAGQILPGSASDAMLQTDRLQAEAPLAKPAAKGVAGADARPGASPAAAASSAPETPAPAAEPAAPTPEATPQATPTATP
ncbi:MAG TPA: hypothetical protein VM055_08115 [Novosphingobium sp.]|nr:hypothetical protein [Novosphingobium sp.]